MLKCISSSTMEGLGEAFFRNSARSADSGHILKPVRVVVPNRDTGRWLQLRLAGRNGISANLETELPARFVHQLNLQADPNYEKHLPDKNRLGWMIFKVLGLDADGSRFPMLHRYIHHEAKETASALHRRYQLSAKLADIYDQYQLFRPDWIAAWNRELQPEETGSFSPRDKETAAWQMKLWRTIRSEFSDMTSRPELQETLLGALKSGEIRVEGPLHVMATGGMPPAYIKVLTTAGVHETVYWYRISHENRQAASTEKPHPLFFQSGKEQTELETLFQKSAEEAGAEIEYSWFESTIESEKESDGFMLDELQQSIRSREPKPLQPDNSIRVHACHNPLREVEVLHDQITEFFQENPDAGPSDVLVTAPSLPNYVTAVKAVFGRPPDENLRLPYYVFDPSSTLTGRLFSLLTDLMNLPRSRFRAGKVLELLQREPVRDRYELQPGDLELLRKWLRETGVRWGIDASQRGDDGIHSWEFGLDRILMGIMQPPEDEDVVMDTAPFTDVEGSDQLRLAGALYEITACLKEWMEIATQMHTPAEWKTHAEKLAQSFLPDTADYDQAMLPVRQALAGLEQAPADPDEKLPLEVISDALMAQFRERAAGSGYRYGGITFSAMVPVRHLPYRFVAVLGLNEDNFPGFEQAPGFDLIFSNPRDGDRKQRTQNRALFLDTLMAARQRLHLSYIGFSNRDGSEMAPSLVVNELLDALYGQRKGESDVRSEVTFKHRLHGFHQDYLGAEGKGKLFTYNPQRTSEYLRIQKPDAQGNAAARMDAALTPAEDEEPLTLELRELIDFLKHPVEWQMKFRANMAALRTEDELKDRDIFVMEVLDRYKVKQDLFSVMRASGKPTAADKEQTMNTMRLSGKLPYDEAGNVEFDVYYDELTSFLEELKERNIPVNQPDPELMEIAFNLNGRDVLLRGRITPPTNQVRPALFFSEDKPKRRMQTWVEHLFMNATAWPDANTIYVAKTKNGEIIECSVEAVKDKILLESLVALWLEAVELQPPATPQAMEIIRELNEAEAAGNEKEINKAHRALFQYFNKDDDYGGGLYMDDNFAHHFYEEYDHYAIEKELKTRTQLVWQLAADHFVKEGDSEND